MCPRTQQLWGVVGWCRLRVPEVCFFFPTQGTKKTRTAPVVNIINSYKLCQQGFNVSQSLFDNVKLYLSLKCVMKILQSWPPSFLHWMVIRTEILWYSSSKCPRLNCMSVLVLANNQTTLYRLMCNAKITIK